MIETEVNNLKELKRSLVLNIQDTNLELGKTYTKQEEAKKALSALLGEISAARSLLASINKEIEDSRNKASLELASIYADKADTEDKILKLEAQIADLRNNLNLISSTISDLEKRKSSLVGEINSLEVKLESKKAEHTSLQADIKSANARRSALLSEISQFEFDSQQSKENHDKEVKKRKKEIEALDAEIFKKQSDFINFKDNKKDYEAKLDLKEENLMILEGRIKRFYANIGQTF